MLTNIVKNRVTETKLLRKQTQDKTPTLQFGACRQHSTDMKTDREYIVQDSSPTLYLCFN